MTDLSLEAEFQKRVKQALKSDDGLDDEDRALVAAEEVKETLKEGVEQKGRMFFGVSAEQLRYTNLTSSVAVEEVHSCYLRHCDNQSKDQHHHGAAYVIYEGDGMGKSMAVLSLLLHKHRNAPKRAIYFGGNDKFATGDKYFSFLTNNLLAGGDRRLSKLKVYDPPGKLASALMNALPPKKEDLKSIKPAGSRAIPGLQEYLMNGVASLSGGSPVLVLEDINIDISDPNPNFTKEEQRDHWLKELGKAGAFLDQIKIASFESGVVTFLTTSNLNMAKFLLYLSEKVKPLKPLKDMKTLTCQSFAWDETAREKFLQLQNETVKDTEKLSDDMINDIAYENSSKSIRDMAHAFHSEGLRDVSMIVAESVSLEVQESEEADSGALCGIMCPT